MPNSRAYRNYVLIILMVMVDSDWYEDFVMTNLNVVFDWFVVANRIGFYYLLRTDPNPINH